MSCNKKLFLTVLCIFAVIYETKAAQRLLECWHCSSETDQAQSFCDVDFSENSIPTDMLKEHHISVVRSCNSTINSDYERPVCRKTVEEANGKTIVKRFCYYTNKSDPLDHCQKEDTDKNVKRIFCQDCLTDKCNSASRFTLGSLCLFLILPFTMIKKYMA